MRSHLSLKKKNAGRILFYSTSVGEGFNQNASNNCECMAVVENQRAEKKESAWEPVHKKFQ